VCLGERCRGVSLAVDVEEPLSRAPRLPAHTHTHMCLHDYYRCLGLQVRRCLSAANPVCLRMPSSSEVPLEHILVYEALS
jgi:hypothetical protein